MKLANVQDNGLNYTGFIFIENQQDLNTFRKERTTLQYAADRTDPAYDKGLAEGKKIVINPYNQFSYFFLSKEGIYQIIEE